MLFRSRAFFRAITSYWDARMDTSPEKVIICLTEKNFLPFLHAFRKESFERDGEPEGRLQQKPDLIIKKNLSETEPEVGIVNLSEKDIESLDNNDVNDWFK